MQIQQKKLGHEHTFTFEDEYVNVAYKDRTGSSDIDVPYASIPDKTSIRIESNEWIRNVGYLWLAIGVFQVSFAVVSDRPLTGTGFWALMGTVCLLWYRFRQVQFTVLQSDHGDLFIIKGDQHDRILEELKSRRIQCLRKLYGEIDFSNDFRHELEKFRWLEKAGAISPEEAAVKIAEIERKAKNDRSAEENVLN